MESLGKDTRRLLQLAKRSHEPPAAAKARLRERLDARLAAAAVVATSGLVGKATLAQAALPVITKSLFVSLVMVGAASVGYVAAPDRVERTLPGAHPNASDLRHSAPNRVERSVVEDPTTLTAPAVSGTIAPGSPVVPRFSLSRDAAPMRAPSVGPALPTRETTSTRVLSVGPYLPSPGAIASNVASPPRAAPLEPGVLFTLPDTPISRTEGPSLAEETQLIRRAHQAILNGAFSEALEALEEHQRRYALGVLQQEREATRIVAFCRLSRGKQAQTMWTRFVSRWPSSPLVARVRASCHWDNRH